MANAFTSGSLTATGSVTLTKPEHHTSVVAAVDGTYGTVTFVFEGTVDHTNWFPVVAYALATGAVASGTVSPSDNSELAYLVPAPGMVGVRVRVTAIASGTITVNLKSTSYVSLPVNPSYTDGGTYGATSFSGDVTLGSGADLLVTGATGTSEVQLTDNLADALSVKIASGSDLIVVRTTNSDEAVQFPNNVEFFGDAGTKKVVSVSTTSVAETVTSATGEYETRLTDNLADAWSVKIASGNDLLVAKTTDSDEAIQAAANLELTKAATLAAAGSAQGDAAAIVNQVTFVSGADGTTGVRLPLATAGRLHFVYNLHASAGLNVYPGSGDDINDGTGDQAVVIEGKTLGIFLALDTATWAAIYTANS